MIARYIGQISFAEALCEQEEAWARVHAGGPSEILGFESNPIVTLGARGDLARDLRTSAESIVEKGFEVLRVDRGGQATLHHPGQLVIFPIVEVREMGARRWSHYLAEITRKTLGHWGIDCRWDECRPGLYTKNGKIVSMGLRLRQGISTHGLAINISNDLSDFQMIRACGQDQTPLDRFPQPVDLAEVFQQWAARFQR